jgi:class 3 adenylate cyclase
LRARVSASLEKKRLRDQEQRYLQQIEVAQARAEHLLHNILPAPIAARLQAGEVTIADNFSEATVLFADLVDFTPTAATLPATAVVAILNELFSAFDDLTLARGLEKIKTIGDAYMAVGGVPTPRADHVEAVADLALAMQAIMPRFGLPTGIGFALRIGIHTGPVVAGVIGHHKFSYDLWGDTVNLASRMEAQGLPGAIQVSAETYERLRGRFAFEARGPISIKGRNTVSTYLLLGRGDSEAA